MKNIISGGPAALEGSLAVGNVIVSANGTSVLGFSHDQIVSLFQSIPVGGTVTLTVSRGYSLAAPSPTASTHKGGEKKTTMAQVVTSAACAVFGMTDIRVRKAPKPVGFHFWRGNFTMSEAWCRVQYTLDVRIVYEKTR